jgi:hypothetical protein
VSKICGEGRVQVDAKTQFLDPLCKCHPLG